MDDKNPKEDFTVDVNVSGWPYRSFIKFKEFALEHTGDHYWPAIDKLLERSKRLEMYEGVLLPDEQEEEIEQPEKRPEVVGISGLTEK